MGSPSVRAVTRVELWGLVFGKVGVTEWLHSWVDVSSILFFPAQCVTDIPNLKAESHDSN